MRTMLFIWSHVICIYLVGGGLTTVAYRAK